MGKSTPSPPDPAATVAAQAAASRDAAITQQRLNAVDQLTPLGSIRFIRGGGDFREDDFNAAQEQFERDLAAFNQKFPQLANNPNLRGIMAGIRPVAPTREQFGFDPLKLTSITELNPTAQKTFDLQQLLGLDLAQLARDQAGRVEGALGSDLDFSGLPQLPQLDEAARQKIEDALFERQAGRLRTDFGDRQQRLEQQLANQGIQRGSQTFSDELERFGRTRNDAFDLAATNAITGAIGEQGRLFGFQQAARNQALQELLTKRNQPINDITALLSNSQIQIPNFGGPPQVGVAAPDVLGAQALSLNQANLRSQQGQALANNLFGLGGSLGAAAILSDRRFKRDIKKIGTLRSGLNVYKFKYIGDDNEMVGVMADEVKLINPDAVVTIKGIEHVDYRKVLENAGNV